MRRHRVPIDVAPPAGMTAEEWRRAIGLFRYLLPYRDKFIAAQGFLLVSTLAGLAFPYRTLAELQFGREEPDAIAYPAV